MSYKCFLIIWDAVTRGGFYTPEHEKVSSRAVAISRSPDKAEAGLPLEQGVFKLQDTKRYSSSLPSLEQTVCPPEGNSDVQ